MKQTGTEEVQIVEQHLPNFAGGFLRECKANFDTSNFRFLGYSKRILMWPADSQPQPQYSVVCIGESNIVIGHGLCLEKRNKGIFSYFKPVIDKTRMFQTLFTNGFRLITTDMHDGKSPPVISKGVSWNSSEKKLGFQDLLGQHRLHVSELTSGKGYQPIELQSLKDYLEFPQRYKFPKDDQ